MKRRGFKRLAAVLLAGALLLTSTGIHEIPVFADEAETSASSQEQFADKETEAEKQEFEQEPNDENAGVVDDELKSEEDHEKQPDIKDLDINDAEAVYEWLQSLPKTLDEFKKLPAEWWDELPVVKRAFAESQMYFMETANTDSYRRYNGESRDEVISLVMEGLSLERFFEDTIYEGLDMDTLLMMQEEDMSMEDLADMLGSISFYASERYAVLTSVGNVITGNATYGRTSKKTLGGQTAFCLDRYKDYARGSLYGEQTQERRTGEIGWIIANYSGSSGMTFAAAQLTIWAIREGVDLWAVDQVDHLQVFVMTYCNNVGMSYSATSELVDMVREIAVQCSGKNVEYYVYKTSNGNYQSLATAALPEFETPDPDPDPPTPEPPTPTVEPEYDSLERSATASATRTHSVYINRKSALVTGEILQGAVFTVKENGRVVGTITTDANGKGSLTWTITESGSGTSDRVSYCSNYDELDDETKATVSGYTNEWDAANAAQDQANRRAQRDADAKADAARTITVEETGVPHGFNVVSGQGNQSFTLAGNDSETISVENQPWKAKFSIIKVDGENGYQLTKGAAFILMEWNGTQYVDSTNYTVFRKDDGTYTVKSAYQNGEEGYLYYTQQNQGKFGLRETYSPEGYVKDNDVWYFEISRDNMDIKGRNADPSKYSINNDQVFANQPTWVQIIVPKVDRYSGNMIEADAVFTVYAEDGGSLSKPVTFTKQADGSYLSSKVFYADTVAIKNYGKFYVLESKAPNGYYGDWEDESGEKVPGTDSNKTHYGFVAKGDLSNMDQIIVITNDGNGEKFWNERQYGFVTLYKVDNDVDELIANGVIVQGDSAFDLNGAVYGLYAAEDIMHPDGSGILYNANDLVYEGVIGYSPVIDEHGYLLDADGNRCIESGNEPAVTETPGKTAFGQVELGKYFIREISPADGYLMDTTAYRGDELTKYFVTFSYNGEGEVVVERDEKSCDDDNNLSLDDALDTSTDVYSGDYVKKQAAQFVKLDDYENDSEGSPIEGAGFSIYLISELSGVKNGTIVPANGTSWTKIDMEELFADYDFTNEKTALVYKRTVEGWSDGDNLWLVKDPENGENAYRVGEMFSDADGYFVTPELPYGQYVLVETTVPKNKIQADPMLVTINKDSADAMTIRYIENEAVQTFIRVQKNDTDPLVDGYETVLKEGAKYRIKLLSDLRAFEKENDNLVWSVDAEGYLSYKDVYLAGSHVGTASNPFSVQCVYDPTTDKIVDAYLELHYRLPSGSYELVEVFAPAGFVQNGHEDVLSDATAGNGYNSYVIQDAPASVVTFDIDDTVIYPDGQMGLNKYVNADEFGNLIITVMQENKEQKGIFEITKYGEQLLEATETGKTLAEKLENDEDYRSVSQTEAYEQADYEFKYVLAPVAGAVFEIYAAEDIYTQQIDSAKLDQYGVDLSNYLVWHKDDLVATITTDEYGYAYAADLYLGKYYVKEVVAGDGFVLNTEVKTFELTHAEQTANFVWQSAEYVNERQKVEVEVAKRDVETEEGVAGAVFGLYTKNDVFSYITDADAADIPYFTQNGIYVSAKANGVYLANPAGTLVVAKDTLIATAVTGADGVAKFDVDLPLGEYYVVELEAPEGYTSVQPAEKLIIAAPYVGQDVDVQEFGETDGLVFANQKTKHVFTKSDIVSAVLLDDAVLQILEIAVDEDGEPVKENGEYVLTLVEEWTSDKEEVHYFYEENGFLMETDAEHATITKYGHLLEGLKEGRQYIFRELTAPEGYVGYEWSDKETKEANMEENTWKEEVRFTVQDSNIVAEHDMKDQRVVGNIIVTKEGEVLTKAEVSITDQVKGFFHTIFSYVTGRVAEAEFEVYVKETIYTPDKAGTVAVYEGVELVKDAKVATIVTDRSGYAKLENLPLGSYYVKEVKAGNGDFVLNPTITDVTLAYKGQTVPVVVHDSTLYVNERQTVDITISKRDADTMEGVAGAVYGLYAAQDIYGFEVDSETGVVTKNPDAMIAADTLIEKGETGDDGVAEIISDLPCAKYYVKELSAPTGYTSVQPKATIVVDASYKGQTIDAQFYDEESGDVVFVNQKTKHVFTKSDFTSAVILSGAKMEVHLINVDENGAAIKNSDGSYATTLVDSWISDKEEVHYFYENDGYYIEIDSESELPAGKTLITKYGHLIEGLLVGRQYIFREITAPDGYVGYEWSDDAVKEANKEENLITEEIRFTVADSNIVAEHEMKDQRVVGNIVITKEGEVFTNAEVKIWDTIKGYINHIFSYVLGRVENAEFEVYVKETIYTPDKAGTVAVYEGVELVKDAKVATIVTDKTGFARLENLPLGTYYVKEVKAGNGDYLLNPTVTEVALAYQGQEVAVVINDDTYYKNERQKVELTVYKRSAYADEYTLLNTGEKAPEEKSDLYHAGVVFGLYAAEDMYGYEVNADTGVVTKRIDAMIAADTLIEDVVTDANGKAVFVSDLPCGKYYLMEKEAPTGYHTSSEKYVFDASYQGQDGPEVIKLSYDFYNKPVVVAISKSDITTAKAVVGAKLVVTDAEGKEIDSWITDGTVHYIKHLELGKEYTLTETIPGPGYVTAEAIKFIIVDVDEDGAVVAVQEVDMKDDYTKLKISKKDITNGKELPGAKLQIIDLEGNIIKEWISTDEPTYFEYIPIGEYILREFLEPEGYAIAEDVKFEIKDTGEIQYAEMFDNIKCIVIDKVAAGNGKSLKGAVLELYRVDKVQVPEKTGKYWMLSIEDNPAHATDPTKPAKLEYATVFTWEFATELMKEFDMYRIEADGTYTLIASTTSTTVGTSITKAEFDEKVKNHIKLAEGVEKPEQAYSIQDKKVLIEKWTTDGTPKTFEKVKDGTYILHEVSAPNGYYRADDITFTVDRKEINKENKYSKVVVMVDKEIPPEPPKEDKPGEPEETGDTYLIYGGVAILMTGLAGSGVVLFKRRRDEEEMEIPFDPTV